MAPATLTINSRNYGSWSLRGWLLCRMAGLEFVEDVLPTGDPAARAELLLLSPSFLVPRLDHEGVSVWDVLAIAEYLQERFPHAGLLPDEPVARAHCRSVSGEVHGGFVNLRSALPMNMTARHPGFPVFSGAQADIARVTAIWRDCLGASHGPFLFGTRSTVADAMFAPICRGSPPTTSPWTPRAPPTATRCWRCPTSSSGRRWPPPSRRTWSSSKQSSELEAGF